MIILAIGVATGWAMGFLLSDGRRHSALLTFAGVVGAVLGTTLRWAAGPEGPLVLSLTALVGAMVASFAVGARQFSHRA